MRKRQSATSRAGVTTLGAITQGAAATMLLEVLGLALAYLVHLVLARSLGVAEYGKYSLVVTIVFLLAIIASLGFNTAMLRFLPQFQVTGDRARAAGFVRRGYQIPLILAIALAVSIAAGVLVAGPSGWPYGWPLLVGIWALPFLVLGDLNIAVGRAFGRIVLVKALQDIGRPALLLALVAGFVWFGFELVSVGGLWLFVCSLLAIGAAQSVVAWRMLPAAIKAASPRYETRAWLQVSFPFLLTATFAVLMKQTDVLMVGLFMGAEDVGIYSVAVKLSMLVALTLNAVNMLAAPVYAGMFANQDIAAMQQLAARLAHIIFWPTVAAAVFLIMAGQWVLGWFGEPFRAGYWAALILIAAELVNAGAGSVGYLANVCGQQWAAARVQGVAAALNIVLNALLIPAYGIEGAAAATGATLVLWQVWLHVIVAKKIGVRASILFAGPRMTGLRKRSA